MFESFEVPNTRALVIAAAILTLFAYKYGFLMVALFVRLRDAEKEQRAKLESKDE